MLKTLVIGLDLAFGAAAVAGGAFLLVRGRRLSRDWLRGTPFTSYFWPGLVLVVLVGGSLLAAAALLLADAAVARLVSVEAGVVLVGCSAIWLSTGYRHWLQLVSVGLGIAVVVLSLAMPAPG